jgi:hypothetical protein
MYASKVSFSNQTRALINARPMGRNQRVKLRQQRVKDFIRETPNGEARKRDLIEAAGFNTKNEKEYQRGWAIVGTMIRRGDIVENDGSNPKNSYLKQWTIPSDVTVTNRNGELTYPDGDGKTILRPTDDPMTVNELKEEEKPQSGVVMVETVNLSGRALTDMAKQFAWTHNSDSLREFIAWTESTLV